MSDIKQIGEIIQNADNATQIQFLHIIHQRQKFNMKISFFIHLAKYGTVFGGFIRDIIPYCLSLRKKAEINRVFNPILDFDLRIPNTSSDFDILITEKQLAKFLKSDYVQNIHWVNLNSIDVYDSKFTDTFEVKRASINYCDYMFHIDFLVQRDSAHLRWVDQSLHEFDFDINTLYMHHINVQHDHIRNVLRVFPNDTDDAIDAIDDEDDAERIFNQVDYHHFQFLPFINSFLNPEEHPLEQIIENIQAKKAVYLNPPYKGDVRIEKMTSYGYDVIMS